MASQAVAATHPRSASFLYAKDVGCFDATLTTDDLDYYAVTVGAGQDVVETKDYPSGCSFDSVVTLYAADGTWLADDDAGANACSLINGSPGGPDFGAADLAAGTYYVEVRQCWGDPVSEYLVDVQVTN